MKNVLLSLTCLLLVSSPDARADVRTLRDRQQQLEKSLQRVTPALVAVTDNFGAGSGVVVSGDGIVLTASHVVDSRSPRNQRLHVIFPDGSRYRARILGMNRSVDAAMLKIEEKPRNGDEFPYAELGDSVDVKRGDWCFALGHPGGFRKDRPAPVRLGRILSTGYRTLVSDCAIVLGDSGGPLFDMEGKVIGIHSMITEVIVENRHVAIDCFRRDGDRMENGEIWGKLKAHDSDIASSDFFGVVLRWRNFTPEVARLAPESPADNAGIRVGDILIRIAGQTFADPLGLTNLLDELAEDQKVEVVVDRHGEEIQLTMVTGDRPDPRDRRPREQRRVRPLDRDHFRELQNQLTSMRRVGPFEKRAVEELERFVPALKGTSACVVEFRVYGETVAFGSIMSEDGYILTKASELSDIRKARCVMPDGRNLRPVEVATDYAYDLMLVKVPTTGLQPVRWSREQVKAGRIVVTTDGRGTPILPGVISVATRRLPTAKKGFLGVSMSPVMDGRGREVGVRIERIFDGGAAQRFGVQVGDEVLKINDVKIDNRFEMVQTVQAIAPNEKIKMQVRRGDEVKTLDVVLTPRFLEEDGDVMLERYRDPEELGKFASKHNSGFPQAMQHDTDLYPHQCGGPLFDITGRAVGLNIARAARITSYAIPADAVLEVYQALKAQGKNDSVGG